VVVFPWRRGTSREDKCILPKTYALSIFISNVNGIMTLLELPDEILQDIVKYSLPYGFESFILACKRIYTIGKENIAIHNRLKRTYKDFQYGKDIRCAIQLLHRIANEPLIAEYIEEADLHPVDEYYDWGDAHEHMLDDEKTVEDITRFVKASDFYRSLPAVPKHTRKPDPESKEEDSDAEDELYIPRFSKSADQYQALPLNLDLTLRDLRNLASSRHSDAVWELSVLLSLFPPTANMCNRSPSCHTELPIGSS
jgi:hypothetical protein